MNRTMQSPELEKKTVAEIVREDFRTARVFKQHRIDFCCGGGKSLEQACRDKKISLEELLSDLAHISVSDQKPEELEAYDQWTIGRLIEHIVNRHHTYVEENLPIISEYLRKLAAVHGHAAPALERVRDLFEISRGNLAQHMKKEELIMFPRIKMLYKLKDRNDIQEILRSKDFEGTMSELIDEHSSEGSNFDQMEALTNGFSVPEWGCNTYHVAMQMLREMQDDLHTHIHLENNILFPKAVELYRSQVV